jgi:FG-GAP-like repeat/Abnormal spindle-like microcephaly-assoc'd, ASPM-SPD-2-Hydin/Cep192 domain 4
VFLIIARAAQRCAHVFFLIVLSGCFASVYGQGSANPIPFLNQPVVPMSVAPGGSGFTLTVNGVQFVSSSVVQWNGTALVTTFVSSSQLTAAVPASVIATPGTASVTVSNPTPGGGTSNVAFFDVSSPSSGVTFTQLPPNPSFVQLYGMVTADFNGDGKLDLAYVSLATAGSIVIQLGNGDGSFQAPVSYPVGNTPTALVAGDFNGDGKLDLAVTNTQDNTISILPGNGDGTFQPQVTFTTAPAPLALVVGDFNGDGKLDLAVGNRYQDSGDVGGVSILLGNGDGTFQSHVEYAASLAAYSLTVGDFNREGNLDLIFFPGGSLPGKLVVLSGNGDGTFQSPQSFPSDSSVESLIAVDLNGDGKLDLITADLGGGAYVFLGNGDGTFQSPVEYASGFTSIGVVAEDFNADGKIDLVLTNQDANSFSLLLGNGDGTFQSPTNFPASGAPVEVVAGDFNGDGKMDLASAVYATADTVVVFLQGEFAVASTSTPSLSFGQQTIGTSSPPKTVTLTNTGSLTLTISNVSITGTNASDFAQTNNCPSTLGTNASCLISVTYTPSAAGNRTAAVSITDNGPGSPQVVALTGTTPVFLSPATVTFPAQYVGTSGLPQSVVLNNTGSAALTITSVTTSTADFAPLSTCGNSLGPGASCSIGVFFDPTTSGTLNGILTVTDSASDSPQTVSLTGIGQDFTIGASSSTANISPGQTANYSVSVAPAGGFNQTVLLSCSGAPSESTCAVSSSSIVLNGSTAMTVTVTVATTSHSVFAYRSKYRPVNIPPIFFLLVLFAVASLGGWVWLAKDQRRWASALSALIVLASAATMLSACGGGNSGGGNPGTPVGTYTLTVTGTFKSGSTTLTHNSNLTLVVQ